MSGTELEALVGHLFIVGGRTISAASPGAIAMPPPRRTARGRDKETFFGLLSLSAGEHQPASFYEDLTEATARKYFKVSGSVTAALREAIGEMNAAVLKINNARDQALSVGFACAILREQEVYIAITGPSRCFLLRKGFAERLPDDVDVEEGVLGLGIDQEPDVRYYRREIRTGDFLILADSSFNHLNDETLMHAIEHGEVNVALNNLSSVARDFSAAEVIKFVAPLEEGQLDDIPTERKPRVPPLPSFGRQQQPAEESTPDEMPDAEPAPTIIAVADDIPVEGDKHTINAGEVLQQAGHKTALGLARATAGTKTLVEKMLPEGQSENPLGQRFQLSTTMQIGVAVSVAVLVALLTTAVYKFRGQTSQYAQFVREAQSEIEQARSGGNNQAEARPHWETAVFLLEQAAAIRPAGAETETLLTEALQALDSYDHVIRVQPVLLREYETGAVLRGPIVQGLNLYAIDTVQDILYREDLSEDGTQLVNRESQIVVRKGDVIDNQVVGGLIDLLWMEDGGVSQRNVLATLSRNGLLITYTPSFGVSAALLPGFEGWQEPRAIAVYERDLYVLDSGANEIWRYEASGDSYPNPPQRYFTDVTPDLADAIDMVIDTNGNVFVLHGTGRISKYFFGRPEPFELTGFPQPVSHPTALFLNLTVYDRALFITDSGAPSGGSLYTAALNGTFLANYKDTNGQIFNNALSGVYNLDEPALVYVTSGTRLYYFPRP